MKKTKKKTNKQTNKQTTELSQEFCFFGRTYIKFGGCHNNVKNYGCTIGISKFSLIEGTANEDNLARFGFKTLQSRRESLCLKLFQSVLSDERFSNLLPPRHKASHNFRHSRTFTLPRFRTYRYKRSFIPAMTKYIN